MKTCLLLLAACLLAAGCDSKPKTQPAAPSTTSAPDIIKPQREAMEKAKTVEGTLDSGAEQRRSEIDRAESK